MNKISILINCPSKFNLNSKTLHKIGGIESLNFELARKLTKFNKKITLSTNCAKVTYKNKIKNVPIYQLKQNPTKYNFDIITGKFRN